MPPILTTQTAETFCLVGMILGVAFLITAAIFTLYPPPRVWRKK